MSFLQNHFRWNILQIYNFPDWVKLIVFAKGSTESFRNYPVLQRFLWKKYFCTQSFILEHPCKLSTSNFDQLVNLFCGGNNQTYSGIKSFSWDHFSILEKILSWGRLYFGRLRRRRLQRGRRGEGHADLDAAGDDCDVGAIAEQGSLSDLELVVLAEDDRCRCA